jgi:hypothetical protein
MGMKSIAACVALLLIAGQAVGECETSAEQTLTMGCSGMVLLDQKGDTARYLVVQDRKDKPSHEHYAYLVLVTWTKNQSPEVWHPFLRAPEGERPPSDLEAICAVPGRPDLFLLAESGFYEGKYGRVIVLQSQPVSDLDNPRFKWVRSFRPRPMEEETTPRHKQIEGMACVATGEDTLALVLATVGDRGHASLLHWGALDLDAAEDENVYDERGCAILTHPSGPLCARSCGALQLRPAQPDGDIPVWSAATVEVNEDVGPFLSQVFEAGRLRRIRSHTLFQYCRYRRPLLVGNLEHVKIEALAAPPSWAVKALLVYGTDDEDYGGVYRPLFPRR